MEKCHQKATFRGGVDRLHTGFSATKLVFKNLFLLDKTIILVTV
jgi:hypothetical protein